MENPYSLVSEISDMIERSAVPEANKQIAREALRKLSLIDNGHKGSVEAVSNAVLSQAPLIMALYLSTPDLVEKAAEAAVKKHGDACPAKMITAVPIAERRTGDGPFNWQRFAFSLAAKAGWPSATIVLGIFYRDLVREVVMRFVT